MKFGHLGVFAVLCGASLAAGAAFAGEAPVMGQGSYGQELVARTVAAHHDVSAITIYAVPPGKSAMVAMASNGGKIGTAAPAAIDAVQKSGHGHFAVVGGSFNADLVQYDMSHKPAGVLSLSLNASGKNTAALTREAMQIENALARRISYTLNLFQTAHMDPNVPENSYAQHLIDSALERHPDVLIMAIHATTPKNADPEILASNIGRIGKKADDDDMRVVKGGQTNLEVNKRLVRYEVELPLNDVSGVRIGALGVVFPLTAHTNQKARHAEAIRIRDEISRRILKPGNLVEPWPYDPHYSDNTYAQHLVDRTLAAHPAIRVLALHVTPPGEKTNIILASNIGRIGKKADSDDMGVVNSGKPDMATNKAGNRFEVELALKDRKGHRIGAVSVVYGYKKGDDKAKLQHHAQAIADALARRIPDAAALFKPHR